MRIRRIGPIAIATAVALLAGTAHADDYFRKGYYLNGSFAYGFNQMETGNLSNALRRPLETKNAPGLNIRAGSQVYSWLAVELEYEWMSALNIAQPDGYVVTTYNPDIITVNSKFVLPFWRFQPYLLVGGGIALYDIVAAAPFSTFSDSGSGFAFRGGGGLDVFVTKHIAVNVEATYVLNTSSYDVPNAFNPFAPYAIDNLYYLSLSAGLTYHF